MRDLFHIVIRVAALIFIAAPVALADYLLHLNRELAMGIFSVAFTVLITLIPIIILLANTACT